MGIVHTLAVRGGGMWRNGRKEQYEWNGSSILLVQSMRWIGQHNTV